MPTLPIRFYPSLGSFMQVDHIGKFKLPEAVAEFLTEKFSHIYVKDFQFSKSLLGDNGFYSCAVVTKKRLGVEIPGTASGDEEGIMIILNPDHDESDPSGRSVFPITVGYNWPILGYLRSVDFDLDGSTDSGALANQVFEMALKMLKLSDRQVIAHCINVFSSPTIDGLSNIDQFIADYNAFAAALNRSPIGPITAEDKVGELLSQMQMSMEQSPVISVLGMYILQDALDGNFDWNETKRKLNQFFRGLLPTYDIESYLRDLMLPKFSASLELSAAIEFPRHLLLPATKEIVGATEVKFNVVGDDAKFSLQFQPATFEYHSQRGFTNDLELTLKANIPGVGDVPEQTMYYALIGNTGLVMGLDQIKLDISDERNILEATIDGRTAFKGVYINALDLYLPKGFVTDPTQPMALKAREVLIGTPDGVSGVFELTGDTTGLTNPALVTRIGEMEIRLTEFYLAMSKNTVSDFTGSGELLLPQSEVPIAFTMTFDGATGRYRIVGSYNSPISMGTSTVQIAPNLALPIDHELLNQPVIVVEFDKTGVQLVAGSLALDLNFGGNNVQATASIGYNNETENVTIAATGISGLALDFGPVNIQPTSLSISFGNSSVTDFDTTCLVRIKGVKAINNDGTTSALEAVFEGSYISNGTLRTIDIGTTNSTLGAITTLDAARLLGFDLSIGSLTIVIDSGSNTLVSANCTNTFLTIPADDGENETVTVGLTIEAENGLFEIAGFVSEPVSIGQVDLQMVGAQLPDIPANIPLSFTLSNQGVEAVSGAFWLSFPKGKVSQEENAETAKIRIDASFNSVENSISFVASDLADWSLNIGSVKLIPQSVGLAMANGQLEEAYLSGIVELDGCYQDQNETTPSSIPVIIEITPERVRLYASIEVNPEDQPTLYLNSVKIVLSSFDLSFNRNGFLSGSNVKGIVDVENSDFIEEPIQVEFTFYESGFDVLLESEVNLLESEQVNILLNRIRFGKQPGQNVNFEIGGELATNLSVPALTKVIPQLVDINTIGYDGSGFVYDLSMQWEGGYAISGSNSTGFGGYLPTDGLSLGDDTVTINKILLKVKTESDPVAKTSINVEFYGLAINIGPFTGVVDGMGLAAVLTQSTTGQGNFGKSNLGLEFRPPKGIGVSISQDPLQIAGYLYLDHENSRYYGYLSIHIKSFGLDAIGIYAKTDEGFSFLALVTVELPKAIPLVFGFYLQGAGGIVALHRGLNPEAMRDGVKNGTLDQVFFPENVLSNLESLLQQLESYFPEQHGVHSFGLLFDLTYGDSDMVHIELGVLIRTQPFLLGLAGTIKINAPDPNSPKVVLNCAFLGYYDSGKQLISFDARIYNSNIAGIGLEGDIAARLGWGNNKMFVISVGGFHPQFVPDTTWNIGNMNRMAVRLRDTDSLKIFVESYFAVTSNTFQIGAKGSLVYRGGGFEAEANTGFDALFYFNPFRFTVSISASAQVSWRSFDIAAVYVQGSISGPGIWNANGSASFEVACFNPSFHFDVSWGNNNDQGLPPINVQEILEAELEKNSSWKGSGLQDKNVTYKQIESSSNEDTPLILAPHDSLTVNQLVVPLELNIQKFGENPVTGPTNFKIDSLEIGGAQFETAELIATEDYFAPNQFKSLNDQQRLQSASYEKLKSGATTNPSAYGMAIPIHNTAKEITYEQFYKGSEGVLTQEPIQLLTSGDFSRQDLARGGALGRNREFRANKRKSNMKNKVRVVETEYSIVNKDTLIKYDNDIVVSSRTQALEILLNSNTIASTEVSKMTVAPKFEHRKSVFAATENLGYDK